MKENNDDINNFRNIKMNLPRTFHINGKTQEQINKRIYDAELLQAMEYYRWISVLRRLDWITDKQYKKVKNRIDNWCKGSGIFVSEPFARDK